MQAYDRWHWQVRKGGKVVADWWPHKGKWRIARAVGHGHVALFITALGKTP